MLDTDPRVTELTAATFPGKPGDVEALNAGTYSILNTLGGGDQSSILNNPFYWWSLMSDDCYGSGGLQDNVAKSLHHFTTASANQYEQDFILLYGGISRANNQIETIDNVDWTNNTAQRNQLLGEGYFMRGFYTLLLTQLYGDVPLITSTTITADMQKEVSAEEKIYPQILSDFVSAKNLMKAERANGSGHADKFTAESFIARAWMFWAGFYKGVRELAKEGDSENTTVALVAQEGCPEGSKLTKTDVINALKDVVNNGGYKLCEDFRSLWQYSNYLSCFWGLRNGASNDNGKRDKTYPFNQGWGQGTPSVNIWADWSDDDLRKKASLINLNDTKEVASYTYEKDDCEESGVAVKKYADVNLDACAADNDSWWSKCPGYTSSSLDNKQQGDHFEDYYLMRYSDVLLMLTELTGDAQYMNEVQRRAKVTETAYTLENVQNERRWEFALEGLRFNDMRRWSGCDKHSETSYAARALQAQSGKSITVRGKAGSTLAHMTCSWSKRYADTKGFLPKPQSQINLMNGGLVQNPGWDDKTPAKEWTYKVLY